MRSNQPAWSDCQDWMVMLEQRPSLRREDIAAAGPHATKRRTLPRRACVEGTEPRHWEKLGPFVIRALYGALCETFNWTITWFKLLNFTGEGMPKIYLKNQSFVPLLEGMAGPKAYILRERRVLVTQSDTLERQNQQMSSQACQSNFMS